MNYIIDKNDMELIADAIRSHYYLSDSLLFPNGMISLLEESSITPYTFNQVIDGTISGDVLLSVSGYPNGLFYQCENLSTVTNCSNVLTVGNYAFYKCYNLSNFVTDLSAATLGIKNIWETCTSIGRYAFAYASKFTPYPLTACTNIDTGAFMGAGIINLNIPVCAGVGASAFQGCTSLTQVTSFGISEYLYNHTFYQTINLLSANFANITRIYSYAFYNCKKLASISLPALVSLSGESIFYNCNALTTLSLPKCRSISGSGIFNNCSNLSSLYIRSAYVIPLSKSVNAIFGEFSPFSKKGTGKIYVRTDWLTSYKTAAYWSEISNRIYAG